MQSTLKQKTANGLIWSTIERFALQGIQFIIGIIMARILSPMDYGMIGMLALFIAVSQLLIDGGFTLALVREPNRTEADNSTIFYFNIVVGVAMYFVLFFCSPLIASFFNVPLLEPLTKVIALPIIFNSLCIVQGALFTIAIDFKTQAKISIITSICTGVIGIWLAYSGYGVWALAFSQVAGSVVRCALLWILSKWRPQERFSMLSFKKLFAFGSKLLASGMLDTVFTNIYPLIIGKIYSGTTLGFYTRARDYANLPTITATGILSRVTFPVLCQLQNDDDILRSNYRKMMRLSAFVIFPMMFGLAALARPLVLAFITEKWEPCVILLQILCIAQMWYPIHALNLNLLQVKGRSDWFLKLEFIKKIIILIVLVITIPMGIIALCVSLIVTSLISLMINTHYTGILINLGFWKQIQDLLPTLLRSAFMAALILGVNYFIVGNWLKIIVGLIIGITFYIGTAYFMKSEDFNYLLIQIKSYFRKNDR